jgi:RNA polymerase sigma-70 factor, ECF subfamily
VPQIDDRLVLRLHRQAGAGRWRVSPEQFGEALAASAARAFAGRESSARDLDRYLHDLHLTDLALACACAAGDEEAWEHFVREQRPALYRAADAIDPGGGARELADSLYAELFGLDTRGGARRSLFRYFHGRSSLATWLRAVLAQRHVDRVRSHRRTDPLPDEDSPRALAATSPRPEPDRDRHLALMREAIGRAIAALDPRDRLRLGCYYGQELTLAQTGRLLGEHEATVSRQLARARRTIRTAVERALRDEAGLSDAAIADCFESVARDAGPIDLANWFDIGDARKKSGPDRSPEGEAP